MEEGYRVEFASCGLMTAAVGTKEGPVYLCIFCLAKQLCNMIAKSKAVHKIRLFSFFQPRLCKNCASMYRLCVQI